jgi:hypothetical protein
MVMTDDWTPVPLPGVGDAGSQVDARLAALLGAASGPLNWHALRSVDAADCWEDLRAWVDWFRGEYGFDHRVVPPCWYRHSALVSVLSALRDRWLCAYDPLNTPVGSSDWHVTLMQLEPRLRDWASRTGCTVAAHRDAAVAEYPADTEVWKTHVVSDVDARAERETRAGTGTSGHASNAGGWTGLGVVDGD